MKKKMLFTMLAFAIIACFIAAIAFAAAADWKLVIKIKGDVESQKQGLTAWDKIWQSRMLKDGDKARTGADSQARIKFGDQSVGLLGSNTTVEISQFDVTDTERTSKVKLILGKIRVFVSKFTGKKNTFEVVTPNAVLAARGTEFYVGYADENGQAFYKSKLLACSDMARLVTKYIGQASAANTRIAVFSGEVIVSSAIERYVITSGQTALVNAAGSITINPASFPFPAGAPAIPGGDADLMHPKQSLSDTEPSTVKPPAQPPLYNPANPVSTPCPAP